MAYADLINEFSTRAGIKKGEAKRLAEAFIDCVRDTLMIDTTVRFGRLGTFNIVDRAARRARNPQTGETVEVPAKKAVKFKASREFKEAINSSMEEE